MLYPSFVHRFESLNGNKANEMWASRHKFDKKKLIWTPYVSGFNNASWSVTCNLMTENAR